MPKKLPLILLVDDNKDDNYLHCRSIRKVDADIPIEVCLDGEAALSFLKRAHSSSGPAFPQPDLIMLDINMPLMNGWEFLNEYDKMPAEAKGNSVIIVLTTSLNPIDKDRAANYPMVQEYQNKPLTTDKIRTILHKYFS